MGILNSFIDRVTSSTNFRNASMLFTARSLNSVLAFLFTMIAGRILTVEGHGSYGQSMARIILIQGLAEIGLQYSMVRYLVPAMKKGLFSDESAAIVRASLILKFYAVSALFIFTLFLIFSLMIAPSAGMHPPLTWFVSSGMPDQLVMIWLIFLGGVGLSFYSYLDSVLTAQMRYLSLSLWVPSMGVLRLLFLTLVYVMEPQGVRAEHLIYAYVFAPYISIILFFIFFPAAFFFQKTQKSEWSPWVRKLLVYNIWIVFASFFSVASDWMEILLIGDETMTGLYNAARMPIQGFAILLTTMQSLLLPFFSGLTSKDQYISSFKKIYPFIALLVVALLPGFWLISIFIPAWYGQQYAGSVLIFWIIYPNYLLRLFFAPLGTALFALDQPRLIAIEAALRMIFGFVLNLIFIPIYGLTGAASAGFLSQFAGWFFLLWCYTKYFKRGTFPFQKKIEAEEGGTV